MIAFPTKINIDRLIESKLELNFQNEKDQNSKEKPNNTILQ